MAIISREEAGLHVDDQAASLDRIRFILFFLLEKKLAF
jgi:hypothetical protein